MFESSHLELDFTWGNTELAKNFKQRHSVVLVHRFPLAIITNLNASVGLALHDNSEIFGHLRIELGELSVREPGHTTSREDSRLHNTNKNISLLHKRSV